MFLRQFKEGKRRFGAYQVFAVVAVLLSATILLTSLPSEAKRSRSKSSSSSSGLINPNTGLPLIAPIPEIYRTPVNQAPKMDSFSISGPNQNKTSAAAGESVTMSFNLKSNIAASNVLVQFTVQVLGGAPDQIIEVRNLSFRAGQTRLVRATWTLRATDRIGRVFWSADVYHNGQKVASEWSSKDRSRGYHLMFRQTTGVGVFGSNDSHIKACGDHSEIQIMPCILEDLLASFAFASDEAGLS